MLVYCVTTTTKAELIDRGGGLIYDTCLDITWLQNPLWGQTQEQTWDEAKEWVEILVYQGYSDWRLPSVSGSAKMV